MKYKNLVIKCKNNEELIKLQKHLFTYKYAWFDNSCRNRKLKKPINLSGQSIISYIVIQSDDIIEIVFDEKEYTHSAQNFIKEPLYSNCITTPSADGWIPRFKVIDYTQFERKIKLKKINNAESNNITS